MSSLLKKTGGLSFKPKAQRRPGARSTSQVPGPAAPARAPTIETDNQAPSRSHTHSATPTSGISSTAPAAPSSANAVPKTTDALLDQTPNSVSERANLRIDEDPVSAQPAPLESLRDVQQSEPIHPVEPRQDLVELEQAAPQPGRSSADVAPAILTPSEVSTARKAQRLRKDAVIAPPSTVAARDTSNTKGPQAPVVGGADAGTSGEYSSTPRGEAILELQSSALPLPIPSASSSQVQEAGAEAPALTQGANEAVPSSEPSKPKRSTRKRKATEDTGRGAEESSRSKPKRTRKKTSATVEEQDGEIPDDPERRAAPRRFRRRRQEPPPEDAENVVIDRTITKLGDLTKDLGIGKPFKYADAIAERHRQARREAKLRKLERQKIALGLIPPPPEGDGRPGSQTPGQRRGAGGNATEDAPEVTEGGNVGYEIIDGQIVINQQSLVVDQHAAQDASNLETVEEDEFTHMTTSSTYMRKSRSMGTNHWTDEETERFFHFLQMFGTDFETISHMFPGKNRRMIKLKFNREERQRPKRVNAAVMARGAKRVPIDIDEYKTSHQYHHGAAPFQTKDKILEEQARQKEVHDADLEARRQQRRDMGMLDDQPAQEDSGAGVRANLRTDGEGSLEEAAGGEISEPLAGEGQEVTAAA